MKTSFSTYQLECGLDEVGRGCLAGPVVAAAVIFPKEYFNKEIQDSKSISHRKREKLFQEITKSALSYSIQSLSPEEIDQYNILQSSIRAMHKCIDQLDLRPDFLLVDGNTFYPYSDIPHQCVVKGDSQYLNIAAASILAKVYRDNLMIDLHEKFPNYDWIHNKGYPTKKHREAIQQHGITEHHRKSFKLLPIQYSLDL